jgi:hypothetical protein
MVEQINHKILYYKLSKTMVYTTVGTYLILVNRNKYESFNSLVIKWQQV